MTPEDIDRVIEMHRRVREFYVGVLLIFVLAVACATAFVILYATWPLLAP